MNAVDGAEREEQQKSLEWSGALFSKTHLTTSTSDKDKDGNKDKEVTSEQKSYEIN